MPGDHPAPVVKLPKGTYPAWSRDGVYVKGDRVEVDGVGYEAQWWTHAERPDPNVRQAWESPWLKLPQSANSHVLTK